MSSQIAGKNIRLSIYGLKVERAAAVLPATATGNLFQITGGRVLLTNLSGEFTVAASATVTNLKLNAINTASAANADLCTNGLVTSAPVGTLVSMTAVGSALLAGVIGQQANELVLGAGFIRAVTDATNTGQARWTLTYVPLDDGAAVVAV